MLVTVSWANRMEVMDFYSFNLIINAFQSVCEWETDHAVLEGQRLGRLFVWKSLMDLR
jgi:hypothetical protein